MSTKPTPLPTQEENDVLARMMQAEENEGGPPPATPCDTPADAISQIHATRPEDVPPENEDTVQITKRDAATAGLETKQAAAREKLGEIAKATGAAWERLRDQAKIAWDELEKAVRAARSEF